MQAKTQDRTLDANVAMILAIVAGVLGFLPAMFGSGLVAYPQFGEGNAFTIGAVIASIAGGMLVGLAPRTSTILIYFGMCGMSLPLLASSFCNEEMGRCGGTLAGIRLVLFGVAPVVLSGLGSLFAFRASRVMS
jgi:hypothetical protein